jgi:hypothetical protein
MSEIYIKLQTPAEVDPMTVMQLVALHLKSDAYDNLISIFEWDTEAIGVKA